VWLYLVCLLAVGIANWFTCGSLTKSRRVEIRPDCLIIEGAETFWLRYMESGWPAFQPDGEGNQVLCGSYGAPATRAMN
jgi:hypothetical protein